MPSSSSSSDGDLAAAAESFVSFLLTQKDVDEVCRRHGVPEGQFAARPAGAVLRASSKPPPGALCVYAHALEAGMRVPLHGFFSDALTHFRLAPAQLVPNGWRIMAGFVVLCHLAGVPPSLAVFRHFFCLSIVNRENKGWYCFRSKDTSGLRFSGMPQSIRDWKTGFFFLSSKAPWPCPVKWGVPPKSSFMEPVLTPEEKAWAVTLLRSHGAAPVDVRTCLCESNLDAAKITAALPRTPSSARSAASSSKGMDPFVFDMMKKMRAEKAAAQASASANKVKIEPAGDLSASSTLCEKKRSLEKANGVEEGTPPAVLLSTPPATPGCSVPGGCSPPPDFSLDLEEKLVARDAEVAALREELEKSKAELSAAKEAARAKRAAGTELEKTKAELEKVKAELSAAKEAARAKRAAGTELEKTKAELEKVKAELSAAKEAARAKRAAGTELEKTKAELEKVKAELSAAKEAARAKRASGTELEKTTAELGAAKRAAEADSAAAAAVQEFLASAGHVRRRAVHALDRYERSRGTSTARSGSTRTSPPQGGRAADRAA